MRCSVKLPIVNHPMDLATDSFKCTDMTRSEYSIEQHLSNGTKERIITEEELPSTEFQVRVMFI